MHVMRGNGCRGHEKEGEVEGWNSKNRRVMRLCLGWAGAGAGSCRAFTCLLVLVLMLVLVLVLCFLGACRADVAP